MEHDEKDVQASLEKQPSALQPDPPKKRNPMVPIVVLLSLLFATLLFIKSRIQPKTGLENTRVEVVEGATIPDIELTQMDGKKVSLSSLGKKVVLINFWATWCEACMVEMPSLVKLHEKFKDQGFAVLGINLDNNPDKAVPPVISKLGINFPIFKDEDGTIGDRFDVHAIPLTIVLNDKRTILYNYAGDQDWNTDQIHELVQNWLN